MNKKKITILEKRKKRGMHIEVNIFTVSFYALLDIIGLDKFAIFSTPVDAI